MPKKSRNTYYAIIGGIIFVLIVGMGLFALSKSSESLAGEAYRVSTRAHTPGTERGFQVGSSSNSVSLQQMQEMETRILAAQQRAIEEAVQRQLREENEKVYLQVSSSKSCYSVCRSIGRLCESGATVGLDSERHRFQGTVFDSTTKVWRIPENPEYGIRQAVTGVDFNAFAGGRFCPSQPGDKELNICICRGLN